ncbi:MAG: hypothetical protein ACE5OQ_16365, partial [Woeseia sp.]
MVDITTDASSDLPGKEAPPAGETARKLLWRLIWLYVQGSVAAVVVTFFLVFLGLEFTGYQWLLLLAATPVAVPIYVLLDIYVINRHYRPIGHVLAHLDRGEIVAVPEVSRALVRALNLPFYSFIRVTFIHGPAATVVIIAALITFNVLFDGGFKTWQILAFAAMVLFFASPTHAILEFFAISRHMLPVIERLWVHCGGLQSERSEDLISINLR